MLPACAMTRKWARPTRYTLRHNTASIIKFNLGSSGSYHANTKRKKKFLLWKKTKNLTHLPNYQQEISTRMMALPTRSINYREPPIHKNHMNINYIVFLIMEIKISMHESTHMLYESRQARDHEFVKGSLNPNVNLLLENRLNWTACWAGWGNSCLSQTGVRGREPPAALRFL